MAKEMNGCHKVQDSKTGEKYSLFQWMTWVKWFSPTRWCGETKNG